MPKKKIELDKEVIEYLYLQKGLSPYKLGEKFGCSFTTITNRLREWKIPLHSHAEARMRYPKKDFDGDQALAAYMLGFRQGDLNVYIPKATHSETVVVRCHTTDACQVELMRKIFEPYGQVTVSERNGHRHVNCFFNRTFDFLLPKNEIPNWVKGDETCAFAYTAGYVDAEGNFGLNQGRARFKVDAYDVEVLHWMNSFLSSKKIRLKFWKVAEKGSRGWGVTPIFNRDLWRLNVNEGHSLKTFIEALLPHLRHDRRREQALQALENIDQRITYGSI